MTRPANLDSLVSDSIDILALGEKLCHWHAGMDAIYAVGSYAYSGKVHPDRDTIERAKDMCERLIATHTGDESDREELAWCITDLETILRLWPAS